MSIRAKRGTKAQVDAGATGGALKEGELIHVTDTGFLAIATGPSNLVKVGGVEIGDVINRRASPGSDWLLVDGSTYDKAAFPDLGALINPGAGSTFTLPNIPPSGGVFLFIKAL